MKYILVFTVCVMCKYLNAQDKADSISILNLVTVTGIKSQASRHSPFNIAVQSQERMLSAPNFTLTDALARVPGVSKITTGNGISKPVIRGLYGNRIQTVLLGLRFDNQQWQDEHGLGLSIFGTDRVEILKGPSSLLYGTEALGGVINIIEEKPADSGMAVSDVTGAIFSNTLGFSVAGGIKKNDGRKNWRLRLGADSHADYSDGNNKRVLNSRFESYNLKASLGYKKKHWDNQNHFYSSFSRFGFIMQDNTDRKPVDTRAGRKLDGPYHAVLFNILSSQNTLALAHSKLEINGGVHSNLRLENEGGNHISLNMFLNSFSYNARWYKPLNATTELVLGNESQFQVNTNYGARVIIPDARNFETSLSGFVKKSWRYLDFESGVSVNEKNIITRYTQNMDYSSGDIFPFNNWYTSVNGNIGIAINTNSGFNIKLNESSGFRAPNLAELSSNGLHEGTFRYEIGNAGMRTEQNFNSEINVNYESKFLNLYTAAYLNIFKDYIYLAPTGLELYGFDIFRFYQGNARLYGGEITARIKPSKFVALQLAYSAEVGKLTSGNYLPFIPANKLVAEFTWTPAMKTTATIGADIFSSQDKTGEFETPTGSYWLLHASLTKIYQCAGRTCTITLAGDNLLNKAYFDHLSRFKYFGIYNTGISIFARVSVPFLKNE